MVLCFAPRSQCEVSSVYSNQKNNIFKVYKCDSPVRMEEKVLVS